MNNGRYNRRGYEIKDSNSFHNGVYYLGKGIRSFRRFYLKNRFIVALAMAGIVGVNGVSCIRSCTNSINDDSQENIELLDNTGVILDSDYGDVDPNCCDFYYLKLDSGNLTEKDIERLYYYRNVGIITSLGNNVYQTIDNIKDIISRFHINGSILCNLDDISDSDYYKVVIFCEKLEANGCYVGLSGSEESLSRFKKKVGRRSGYDFSKYAVMVTGLDKEAELNNDDNYLAYEIENEIHERVDLNHYIDDADFNEASSFLTDTVYIVKEGDCLETIADTYDIDVNDLITYNNLQLNSIIYPGDQLIIPSMYDKRDEEVTKEDNMIDSYTANGLGYNTNIERVIDVSEHNGHLDWKAISELHKSGKLAGVILRMTEAYNPDTKRLEFYLDKEFEYNLSECNKYGIPYGVYCFSRATNVGKLNNELYDVCNYIDSNLNCTKNGMDLSFNPRLPIYVDAFEDDAKSQEDLINPLSGSYNVSLAADLVNKWCQVMNERYGYYTGLYSNKNLIRNSGILSLLDREFVREIWLAHYGRSDSRLALGEHTLSNSKDWALDENCSMYQISEMGYLFDPNESFVDMNLCDPELLNRVSNYYGNNKTNILN